MGSRHDFVGNIVSFPKVDSRLIALYQVERWETVIYIYIHRYIERITAE